MWLKRNRTAIIGGFGALLITLAVLVPVVVPSGQRSEFLIVTLLFGLTGALMVYAAVSDSAASADEPPRDFEPRALSAPDRARALRQNRHRARNWLGLGFGAFILLAGVVAPFAFPDVGPDERFAMMIGFAPVAVAGAVLMYVFWSALHPPALPSEPAEESPAPSPNLSATATPRPKRAPVARVPKSAFYSRVLPVGIVGMGIAIVIIIFTMLVVVAAAVLPML